MYMFVYGVGIWRSHSRHPLRKHNWLRRCGRLKQIEYVILREKRLRWFGHIEHGVIKTVCNMQIEGKRGPGWPKVTWRTRTERDRREWKLSEVDPCDRVVRKSSVRSAATRYLERSPPMWMMLLQLQLI